MKNGLTENHCQSTGMNFIKKQININIHTFIYNI